MPTTPQERCDALFVQLTEISTQSVPDTKVQLEALQRLREEHPDMGAQIDRRLSACLATSMAMATGVAMATAFFHRNCHSEGESLC